MPSAETFRAREVYRYYQPRDITEPAAIPGLTDSGQVRLNQAPPKDTNFNTQKSFSDTALTAFAQLIALRLASQRAIVSLIDHENEYFLAESTSNLSLIDDDGHNQNAWLSISGARVPRGASLCEQTLRLVPNQDTTAEMTPVFLVPDLRLDKNMSKLDCVTGAPYLRFYCGVALTNKKGVNIGCVYVVDDRPRTDFSLEQAQFLTTMAATVMDHLENIRAKEDIVRVTMMSQALHAFIEGEGTMDGDWQRVRKYNLPAGAGVGFHWKSSENDRAGIYGNNRKDLDASISMRPLPTVSEVAPSQSQSPLQHTGNNSDARFNFNNSRWSSSSETPQAPPLKSVFEGADDAAEMLTGGRDTGFANDGFTNQLHTTFSRASNLVREGMEVDGAVFFDAPFRFYQGRSTLETDTRRLEDQEPESSTGTEARPGPRPRTSLPNNRAKHDEAISELKSDVLGFSTHESSSWANQGISHATSFTAIDQSLLTSLVRRYPRGELFVFDQDGAISPPADILTPADPPISITTASFEKRRARHKCRKRNEMLRLMDAFPGARQIFFAPLYDSTSGCFIGSFAWSTSATRIFSTENHLSYLTAFGHSVMSEVTRLNTMSADLAKGDFISNVSHELRSPLHGILASVEFLADTALDGFQKNLVDTVDICGRTLLDTIEHVLDFSKIKKFGQVSAQPMGAVANLDVSAIIEEVLDGVFAGFEFNGLSSQGLADTTNSRMRDLSNFSDKSARAMDELQFDFFNDSLTVIIDIDYRDQWTFPTVPGTWRRLTMNLFGNSLKYTPEGYIKVKLEARNIPPVSSDMRDDAIKRTMVTMTISDSGQGMSSEFMKTKLFIPFTQEDVTAPGTGLGMSIVKQIVDLSGGLIDIRSDLGKGTEIKLSLPLEDCPRESDEIDPTYIREVPIDAVRRRACGRTVTMRGFDDALGKSDLQLTAAASLKASIKKYVEEWFNLTIVSNDAVADIVISDESAFLGSTKISGSSPRLLLILCSNGARKEFYKSQFDVGQLVEFVSKPCGPHRLAKALLNGFDAEDALKEPSEDQAGQMGLHSRAFLPIVTLEDTKVGVGTSNLRLLGDLKSSIEFSPTATNLNIPPAADIMANETANGRPPMLHRRSSGAAVRLSKSKESSTENASVSKTGSELSSISATANRPASLLENAPSGELGFETAPIPFTTPRMLLVEDNPVNMMLLAAYMKKNGWDYEKAANGLQALQAFERRPEGFDVVFMDVSMPIMTGYESTRRIRTIESERRAAYDRQQQLEPLSSTTVVPASPSSPVQAPWRITNSPSTASRDPSLLPSKAIPALIIALTGFSSQKDQEMAFESGMDIFMTKPVRFREVGRILKGWVESRESESAGDVINEGLTEPEEGMSGVKTGWLAGVE
ncbi:Uncharacterized protein BP5553_05178 [Venustampulla echinocandica]|uniref:Uncharacterized protein n=1 Tax=Venustampulla echinocandica TaxID=2656787 RepID=A0A370TQD6_9HELO|nr:Uncharacterized protein BP5553_05178 [Venustampulla echinocandica]RDL37745.1 Uncharacterized protein BP5553_05178 [Venustampulla echinocandica]